MSFKDMEEYINEHSEVLVKGKYYNYVVIGSGSIVRTSMYVVKLPLYETTAKVYLDLENGNVLEKCIRDGYARVESNIIYLYNYVANIPVTVQDLKYSYEKWCSSGSTLDYFDFFESNFTKSNLGSVMSLFILESDKPRYSVIKKLLYITPRATLIRTPRKNKFIATTVGIRLYNLLRLVGQDYLFIYLKNSPASLNKISKALGLDRLEDQEIVQKGIKEFIYNIPLANIINADDDIEKVNELLLDLGAIANRYKEG